MLTVTSLLAAMTIAGAFWVGVLAARRLRDWGDGRRALEEGGHAPLALAATAGVPPDDPRSRKVRQLVAQRISEQRGLFSGGAPGMSSTAPRQLTSADPGQNDGLTLEKLRRGDVVDVEAMDPQVDGDYIVEGVVLLREGNSTTTVLNMGDGSRRKWMVGGGPHAGWMVLDPVIGHGIVGEPPRNIRRESGEYTLTRRGQASAACSGRHERPEQPRAATYLYTASSNAVLWLERWGHEVLMAEGRMLEPTDVSFLPGS